MRRSMVTLGATITPPPLDLGYPFTSGTFGTGETASAYMFLSADVSGSGQVYGANRNGSVTTVKVNVTSGSSSAHAVIGTFNNATGQFTVRSVSGTLFLNSGYNSLSVAPMSCLAGDVIAIQFNGIGLSDPKYTGVTGQMGYYTTSSLASNPAPGQSIIMNQARSNVAYLIEGIG